jgi:hypothetical protein
MPNGIYGLKRPIANPLFAYLTKKRIFWPFKGPHRRQKRCVLFKGFYYLTPTISALFFVRSNKVLHPLRLRKCPPIR